MTQGMIAADRAVLVVGGADAEKFLENLVTNRIAGMAEGACVYTALLSPKGKYLFDFFVIRKNGEFLIDVKADRAQALAQRLAMVSAARRCHHRIGRSRGCPGPW